MEARAIRVRSCSHSHSLEAVLETLVRVMQVPFGVCSSPSPQHSRQRAAELVGY